MIRMNCGQLFAAIAWVSVASIFEPPADFSETPQLWFDSLEAALFRGLMRHDPHLCDKLRTVAVALSGSEATRCAICERSL